MIHGQAISDAGLHLNPQTLQQLKFLQDDSVELVYPWRMVSDESEFRGLLSGLSDRYPDRLYVPFARRDDSDDVVVFDVTVDAEQPVVIVHDYASPGWEVTSEGRYEDVWDFLKHGLKDD